jgi:hypothetical protein
VAAPCLDEKAGYDSYGVSALELVGEASVHASWYHILMKILFL